MSRTFFSALLLCALCSGCAMPLDLSKRSSLPAAVPSNTLALARSTLARVSTYTNMSDAQLARLREATAAINAQQSQHALDLLNPLERELRTETKAYIVQAGESLWSIAARDDVYANGELWPLLAQANTAILSKSGYQVHKGQKIFVKLHPTIAESIRAINDAKRGDLNLSSE
jgi:nucleoid-associated protein YgaU